MKHLLFLITGCICTSLLMAQANNPVIHGYAYEQAILQGTRPSAKAAEDGTAVQRKERNSMNRFVFLEFKNTQNIVPFRIWIDGKAHRVSNEKISQTPVISKRPGGGYEFINDTLVAKTKNKLLRVHAMNALAKLTIDPLPPVAENAAPGKIVIEYYWRAKRHCYVIDEIKNLEAIPLQ